MNAGSDESQPSEMASKSFDGQISTELSGRRTSMSFERTRLSADRTLMSVIRTSLSLIGFGFTIFQFFQKFKGAGTLASGSPCNFGLALVFIGVGMQIIGIVYHVQFMLGLRAERRELIEEGLIHGHNRFPISFHLGRCPAVAHHRHFGDPSMTLNVWPFD
jgi:inner membrane protein YidH